MTSDSAEGEAQRFVVAELGPMLNRAGAFVREKASQYHLDCGKELGRGQRTLSPADHGFHNTLRKPDGTLVFLDFEYSGWDDPVQMLANACLQPEIPMPAPLREPFLREMQARLNLDRPTVCRLRIVYSLLALKWCLIMMNEFLPVDGSRRRFAGADVTARQQGQLSKARAQLALVEETMSETFFLETLAEG